MFPNSTSTFLLKKDGRLVPGAGAVEMELSKQINDFGKTCEGLEQYSVQRFAKALQVGPSLKLLVSEKC